VDYAGSFVDRSEDVKTQSPKPPTSGTAKFLSGHAFLRGRPQFPAPRRVARQSTKPPTSELSPRNLQHEPLSQMVESLQIDPCLQSAKPPKPTFVGVQR
jgi:hypothetical protein